MTAIRSFIKRHPVPTYFGLTFAISWGSMLILLGPGGFPAPPKQASMLFPVALLAMLLGTSVAGVLLTGLVHGRAGLRELLSRLLRWRVGARWYVVALLTAPFLITAVLFALSLLSDKFLPGIFIADDKASLLLLGVPAGLGAGIFEELGWTGFAVPELRRRYSVLTTGLIVAIVWGVWHFLGNFWGSGDSSGVFSLAIFLPQFLSSVGILPAYRMLMVWVYDRTRSLLVVILMHASLTASTLIFMPQATGMQAVTYDLVLTAVLWVVVAAVAAANRGQLSHQVLQKQVA